MKILFLALMAQECKHIDKNSVSFYNLLVGHMTDGSGLPQGSMTGGADRLGMYMHQCVGFSFLCRPHFLREEKR